jgi:hypothetical protein
MLREECERNMTVEVFIDCSDIFHRVGDAMGDWVKGPLLLISSVPVLVTFDHLGRLNEASRGRQHLCVSSRQAFSKVFFLKNLIVPVIA